MDDIFLYHGSREGIKGDIKPLSRERCDFGKGFYMTASKEHAKGFVAESADAVFYTLKFRLSEIPENKILVLDGEDWVYAVLANRRKCLEFNELCLAKSWTDKLNRYDVIVGDMADDRMNMAFQQFADYGLTDVGLTACLRYVNYGKQYIAKTDFACSKIDIISEHRLSSREIDEIRQYFEERRTEDKNIVNLITKKYQRNGLYLNEIAENNVIGKGV